MGMRFIKAIDSDESCWEDWHPGHRLSSQPAKKVSITISDRCIALHCIAGDDHADLPSQLAAEYKLARG
jgi:hypothetical protein